MNFKKQESLFGIKREIEKAVGGKIELKIKKTDCGFNVEIPPQTLNSEEVSGGDFFDQNKNDLVKKIAKHVKGEKYSPKSENILAIVEKKT